MRIFDIICNYFNLFEATNKYEVHTTKSYNKTRVQYLIKKPKKLALVDRMLDTLRESGKITTNNAHRIKQPIYSELEKKEVDGWVSVWVSNTDDMRLAYKRFDNNVIEVKLGRARDIGYSH